MEPHVDALDVEAVAALGEGPTRFVLFEFGEANGALRSRVRVGLGGVDEDRDGLEDGRVEAARGSCAGGGRVGVGRVHVKDEVGAASVASDLAAARADEVPARVEVEADHEDDHEEEYHYRGQHYPPAHLVASTFP